MADNVVVSGASAPMYKSAAMQLGGMRIIQGDRTNPLATEMDLIFDLSDRLYADKTVNKGSGSVADFTIAERVAEVAKLRNEAMHLAAAQDPNAQKATQQWQEKHESLGMFLFTKVYDNPEMMAVVEKHQPESRRLLDTLGKDTPLTEQMKGVDVQRKMRNLLADTMTAAYVIDPSKQPSVLSIESQKIVSEMLGVPVEVGGQARPNPEANSRQNSR